MFKAKMFSSPNYNYNHLLRVDCWDYAQGREYAPHYQAGSNLVMAIDTIASD